jgi:hypothetical protein
VYQEIAEAKEQALEEAEVEQDGDWEDTLFVRKEFMLEKKMNKFVYDCFARFNKDPGSDRIT